MVEVPELDNASVALGDARHLPKFETLPQEYQRERAPGCKFVSEWFDFGIKGKPPAKPGVDQNKALRAIAAILRSFDPKHEHKIAGAGYLADQWFDLPKQSA